MANFLEIIEDLELGKMAIKDDCAYRLINGDVWISQKNGEGFKQRKFNGFNLDEIRFLNWQSFETWEEYGEEINNCIFCRIKGRLIARKTGVYQVYCNTCNVFGPETDSRDDSIDGWNLMMRSDDEPTNPKTE